MSNQKEPEWYWTKGLHDAELVSVEEKYDGENINLLISLDTFNVMWDGEVQSIEFVNYDCDCDLKFMKDSIWIDDNLSQTDKGYKLKLTLQKRSDFFDVVITFKDAIVTR